MLSTTLSTLFVDKKATKTEAANAAEKRDFEQPIREKGQDNPRPLALLLRRKEGFGAD